MAQSSLSNANSKLMTMDSVPPLFVKDSDIGDPSITPFDMCSAVVRVTSANKLEGIQKINNLWRLYVKDNTARLELFLKQHILINGKNVPLYDQNPYLSRQTLHRGPLGQEIPQSNDKLTIKNVPLSVRNEEIKQMLEEKGIELRSMVKYGYIRDLQGQLTNFKSGDRFVYVKAFDPPLPRRQDIGNFPCLIIHHGKIFHV